MQIADEAPVGLSRSLNVGFYTARGSRRRRLTARLYPPRVYRAGRGDEAS